MKIALFFSATTACLSNASDAKRLAGITPQNKANKIKDLLATCTALACTLRARSLLKSDEKKIREIL